MNVNSLLNLVPKINEAKIAYRNVGSQIAIVDLLERTLNILNPTATIIWQSIEKRKSIKKITEEIVREFYIPFNVAKRDVIDIIQVMAGRNWIINFPYRGHPTLSLTDNEQIFNKIREKAIEMQIPLVVHFDLTYRCVLNCVHCYLSDRKKKGECNFSEVKNILDQLAEAGTLYLTLSGGEVFIRNDFLEIFSYARKLHFAVRILTSGVLIDEGIADYLAAWHPEMVAFSIYSLNSSIHDAITRKKDSLKKTLDAIYTLKEKNIPIKISSVIMNINKGEYRQLYEFAKNLGAQFQADYRLTPRTNGSQIPLQFCINNKEIEQIIKDPIFFGKDEENLIIEDLIIEDSSVFNQIPCGAGHMSCYITPYGKVTPCVQVPIECGDLRKETFREIWNNSILLRRFRNLKFSDIPKCANCKNRPYCRPCLGLNLVEMGDITSPPPRVCKEAEYIKYFNRKRR